MAHTDEEARPRERGDRAGPRSDADEVRQGGLPHGRVPPALEPGKVRLLSCIT